jgi:hypothetical protein
MSVTVSIEGNPTGSFVAECYDTVLEREIVVAEADSYEGILVQIEAHKALCEECAAYGLYSKAVLDVDDSLDVNMSGTNAATVLARLGFATNEYGETCGTVPGEEFLGAVMLAMAADGDDSGVESLAIRARSGRVVEHAGDVAVKGEGAVFVDCGVRPGYYADVFGRLHTLATEAVRLGRSIQWC